MRGDKIMDKIKNTLPKDNQWNMLIDYLAHNKQAQKALEVDEYVVLKQAKDKGDDYNNNRFSELKDKMQNSYFSQATFQNYLNANTSENKIFLEVFNNLKQHLETSLDVGNKAGDRQIEHQGLRDLLYRSVEANKRRKADTDDLAARIKNGDKLWEKGDTSSTIESKFTNIAQESLNSNSQRLNSAIDSAYKIIYKENEDLGRLYLRSIRNNLDFINNPNDREDLSLIDLTYIIGEYTKSLTFRDSTSGNYRPIDTFIDGLALKIPEYETYRNEVDKIHNIVDPDRQSIEYTAKLALINAQHKLGLSKDDVQLYGTITGSISAIMRGFGIDDIDDRFKQYLHNTGDHALRTCVTIASVRNATIKRLESYYQKKIVKALSPSKEALEQELEEQKRLINEHATEQVKKACTHDLGEFLHEVLGNNLKHVSEETEKGLRGLRDQLEEKVIEEYALKEIEHRLVNGPFKWQQNKAEIIISNCLEDNLSKFDHGLFEIFERLNSQHDIITLRNVGNKNDEGYWQNLETNKSLDDTLYTMGYVWGKFTGHKFPSIDVEDHIKYVERESDRKQNLKLYEARNQTAIDIGAATTYEPDITEKEDKPKTRRPLEDYMLEKNIDYNKSIFKTLAEQIIKAHNELSPTEAKANQIKNEALVHSVEYEMIHYTKKQARIAGLDSEKVEMATRKAVAQGVAHMIKDLNKQGIKLEYLKLPRLVQSQKHFQVAKSSEEFLGGIFHDKDRPPYLFGIPKKGVVALTSMAGLAGIIANEMVIKPAKTLPQMMLIALNKRYTQKDDDMLLEKTSNDELGGDIALTITGALQGHGIDGKDAAIGNAILTRMLAAPPQYREAVQKCFPNLLEEFPNKIAEKYGISREAIEIITNRRNTATGEYEKESSDHSKIGKYSEDAYNYLKNKYLGNNLQKDGEKKFYKNIERAEKLVLWELINAEIDVKKDRYDQETSPAQKDDYGKKLKALQVAKKDIKQNPLFKTIARDALLIRFSSIAGFGTGYAFSKTGGEILDTGINTSALYGSNLVLAATSAAMGSIKNKIDDLPARSHLKQFFKDFPQLELEKTKDVHGEELFTGRIYITKGRTVRLASKDELKNAEKLLKQLNDKDPSTFEKLSDLVTSSLASPIRSLQGKAGYLFDNQTTFGSIDASANIAKNSSSIMELGADSLTGGLQSLASLAATVFFGKVGLDNRRAMLKQENPALKSEEITRIIDKELRDGASKPILNALNNLGNSTKWAVQKISGGNRER